MCQWEPKLYRMFLLFFMTNQNVVVRLYWWRKYTIYSKDMGKLYRSLTGSILKVASLHRIRRWDADRLLKKKSYQQLSRIVLHLLTQLVSTMKRESQLRKGHLKMCWKVYILLSWLVIDLGGSSPLWTGIRKKASWARHCEQANKQHFSMNSAKVPDPMFLT